MRCDLVGQTLIYLIIILVVLIIIILFEFFSLKNIVELYAYPAAYEKKLKSEKVKKTIRYHYLKLLRSWILISNTLAITSLYNRLWDSDKKGVVYNPYSDFIKAKKFASIFIPLLSILFLILILPLTAGSFDILIIIVPLCVINMYIFMHYFYIKSQLDNVLIKCRKFRKHRSG
jgi:hypothetical protein